MSQRGDESDSLIGFSKFHVAGRTAGALQHVDDRELLFQLCSDFGQRPVLTEAVFVADITHRHDLNERQLHSARPAEIQERVDLVLIEALQGDGVYFHLKTRFQRGLDSVEHLRQPAPSGDHREFFRVERVQGHIDSIDAARSEAAGEFAELRTIRRECQLVEQSAFQMSRNRLEVLHDSAPDQRFSSGYSKLPDSERNERGAEPVEFLQGQQFLLGQELHFFRHAVHASEVAAISHRNTQISDRAPEWIHQFLTRAHALNIGSISGGGNTHQFLSLDFNKKEGSDRVPLCRKASMILSRNAKGIAESAGEGFYAAKFDFGFCARGKQFAGSERAEKFEAFCWASPGIFQEFALRSGDRPFSVSNLWLR